MATLIDKRREQTLNIFAERLDVRFSNLSLLHQALVHTSFANEAKSANITHNERLEFLGDAILELCVSEHLFRTFPNMPEGELTKARARIVCEPTLAQHANRLAIGEYLLLGRGEAISGGRERISILADAFEAIIGAIYLDGGYQIACKFILAELYNEFELIESGDYVNDYKTLLQEVLQRNGECKIAYEVIAEWGPDHNKTFETSVIANNELLGTGVGKNKKEAEQNAAKVALAKLHSKS